MPRLIDAGDGSAIGVDALVEALDASDFDVCCEESFASLGPLLARLGRNRHFLADLALEELKERCRHQGATNGYGAQVFLLRPANGRYVLRANFWPALADAAVRASGAAAFLYEMPHDHNFSFLTYGYLGPGYWSDYYEYNVDKVAGVPGEFAGLRFVERSRLDLGKLMLYRARRDVHAQLPPDRFSVSLNILAYDPAQPWMDQFRFNLATGAIAGGLTTTPSQALLAIATGFGCGNALDLATNFAAHHPSPRMRITALDAVAGQSAHAQERHAVFAAAINDADAYVSGHARLRCAMIEQAVNTP